MATNKWGTQIRKGSIKRFYHGVGTKIAPHHCFCDYAMGVFIYGPLSTSSSFEVGVQFANANNGVVMEFGKFVVGAATVSDNTYISLSWLSDFSNEHEHLFAQCYYRLNIKNIFDMTSGYEYKHILLGIFIIDRITCCFGVPMKIFKQRAGWIKLAQMLIQHQLSICDRKYEQYCCKSLSNYAQTIIDTHFQNKSKVSFSFIEYSKGQKCELLQIFYNEVYDWINLENIFNLFPNIERINIANIEISIFILDDIYHHLN
eukprot:160161_1